MPGPTDKPRLSLERLQTPISPESPCGPSLRYEGTYDEIRAARTEDDATVSRGVWVAPLRRADWSRVEALCLEALENQSKDLQIAAWLTEAWLHLYGFSGMKDGLQALAGLCEVFWDSLHPRADTDDPEFRFAPFVWLNEKLPPEIRCVPLSSPESPDVQAYSWADWEKARRPNEATATSLQQSLVLTPVAFHSALLSDVKACVELCSRLESILDARCGADAPGLGALSNVLIPIRDFVAGLLQPADPEPTQQQPAPQGVALSPQGSSTIQTRADAYRSLAEAADYLARTEPHSPTPYLIRRAIRWGSMQLTELLPELVRNNDELREICRLLQIPE